MAHKSPRHFDEEFKIEVVNFAMQHPEMSRTRIAADFDISETSLREWINKYIYGTNKSHHKIENKEKEEDLALLRENKQLKAENEILRRAMGILAKDAPPKGFTR